MMKQDNDKDSRHLDYFLRLDCSSDSYELVILTDASDEKHSSRNALHHVPITVVPDDDSPLDAMTILNLMNSLVSRSSL